MKRRLTKNYFEITQVLSERSNVFLVKMGECLVLVDSGIGYERRKLVRQLDCLGVSRIDYLLLTHVHYDHAQNAAFIQKKYHAQVIVHASEAERLRSGYAPLPEGTLWLTRRLIGLSRIFGIKIRHQSCRPDIVVDTPRYYLPENDSDTYILHTPGHTAGSMSFVVDSEVAMVGDAMMGTYRNSIGVPFADDKERLVDSWGVLLDTGCSEFLPGHGVANSRELVNKIYQKKRKRRG